MDILLNRKEMTALVNFGDAYIPFETLEKFNKEQARKIINWLHEHNRSTSSTGLCLNEEEWEELQRVIDGNRNY